LIADLEQRFPALEDPRTGTRIGIGVASGCDDVYISSDSPDAGSNRLLPLVMASDIQAGTIEWSGRHLVNPWKDGRLVELGNFPWLGAYYEVNGDRLWGRHVAKKQPRSWYLTIDRIDPGLLAKPKLLLPDMKAAAHPVLDPGDHYPHHNLYFVVSDAWDLEVLGGILLSDITNLFVGGYCVKMRGGTYRFQAQYLHRIRVPDPSTSQARVRILRDAFRLRDTAKATTAVAAAYGIDASFFTGG
jgi:adenine-specific DNA-methyltransferase